MCGATGEVRLDGRTPDVAAVSAMAEAMAPRGPDAAGVWSQRRVALGHRRLKIIDLSEAGSQPMVDAELGLAIVWNGCIYNYKDLRRELSEQGYRFFSHSDTEVLLKAYHHWGDKFVDRLYGMFAFAIVERDSGRVLLGRDRLGIKPLYITEDAHRVRFASSLPALLAGGGVDTRIDPVALHHYLTFHSVVPPPRTILRGVAKIPPASLVAIEPDGRRTTTTYWEPDFTRRADRANWSERDWEDAVLAALRLAVERRLVADVPVGCLLSGGVDSSLIVGLLAEAGQHGLQTFSIGFESVGGVKGDEFKYSDIIAKRFDTDHHQIRIGTDRMLPALDGAIGAMSEPMVSHDCVAFYLLSQEVAKHVKVVQSGQGADEVFAGYHWYPPMGEPDAASLEGSVASYRKAFFDRDPEGVATLVSRTYLAEGDPGGRFVAEHFAREGAQTGVDRALRLDTTVMLVDDPVKRVDNMTMAWGLEGRVPFLDHELVELAATCPANLKTAHEGKGVLKEAARRVIPADVIDRPKGYFPVPALTHLEGPYLDLVRDALYAPVAKERGLFRPEAVDALLADPNGRLTPLRGNELWQIALLELWLQKHGISGGCCMSTGADDHPEAITLGLHDASPPHMVDAMSDDVVLELGWGRLLFGQTFADADKLAEVLRGETHGRRDICIYARESHVLVAKAPAELFIDPSHTYRLRFAEDDEPAPSPSGFTVRPLGGPEDADTINRVYVRCGMVPAPVDVIWENQQHNDAVTYLVAVRDDDGSVVGAVTGVDHKRLFSDPENGSSLWTLAVDPASSLPGVGAALTRALADDFRQRGRAYMDLSVAYDNAAAIALYEKLGFQRVPVLAVKRKNAINEPLFTHPPETVDDLNPYARIIADEAMRRGIWVEVLDAEAGEMRLSHGGRSVITRESLSEYTSAVAMSRCDDKRLTRRLVAEAGIVVPKGRLATFDEADHAFVDEVGDVVVKPTRGEQGKGITVGVDGPEDLDAALVRAREQHPEVLIEQRAPGDDLRLVVIDGKVVAAALRIPAEITGTGHHSVRELIEAQSRRRSAATGGESRIPVDEVTEATVKEAGWSFDDVLPEGKRLRVRRTANLHQGGTIHDVTAEVNQTLCDVAVAAAEAIGIPVTGIDLLVPDVTGDDYAFIEANERPGLANHEPQPTAKAFVDYLFPGTPAVPQAWTPTEAPD